MMNPSASAPAPPASAATTAEYGHFSTATNKVVVSTDNATAASAADFSITDANAALPADTEDIAVNDHDNDSTKDNDKDDYNNAANKDFMEDITKRKITLLLKERLSLIEELNSSLIDNSRLRLDNAKLIEQVKLTNDACNEVGKYSFAAMAECHHVCVC